MHELALFAGAGGGILGGKLLGWRTVCAVEIEPFPREVLLRRQEEGHLEPFPIWDDVSTFDGKPWRGKVDIVTGGFPCQDISAAGKGAGITGERSGLWKEMARIIGEVRPSYVLVENSPLLVSRGLTTVLGDLAEMGHDARWGVLGGYNVKIPTSRERAWILACRHGFKLHCNNEQEGPYQHDREWWSTSRFACDDFAGRKFVKFPRRLSVDHGVGDWMDEIKAIGNGQVPAVVRLAWEILSFK